MLYLFSVLVTSIMSLNDFPEVKQMKFCSKGLDLIPLGGKLAPQISSDLHDIDTSTVSGQIEYSNVSEGMPDANNCICKHIISGRYKIQGLESASSEIFIGYTKENEVQHIVIKVKDYDFNNLKDSLEKVYGRPEAEITGGMNGQQHKSYSWLSSGIDIYFSGLGNSITFSFPRPKEYFDRLIKGNPW